jgi:hypothetical protein
VTRTTTLYFSNPLRRDHAPSLRRSTLSCEGVHTHAFANRRAAVIVPGTRLGLIAPSQTGQNLPWLSFGAEQAEELTCA